MMVQRLLFGFALLGILAASCDGCSIPGCPTKLESAVIHCSQIQPASPFMKCLTSHPPGDLGRRNCLNRAGFPQLDVCGGFGKTDMEVLSCFEKAPAHVPWEYCVMSHYLRSTKLESAVMECSNEKPGSKFMNCLLFEPWGPHRLHCFNAASYPQLLFCGDHKLNDDEVLKCFEKAPGDHMWEQCVMEKFRTSNVINPPTSKPFKVTIQRSGNVRIASGTSTCSGSAKSDCASAGNSLKTRHCGENLRWYKPWKWYKFRECEACSASCYARVTKTNLQKILGTKYCGEFCVAAAQGALRSYCDHYSARCAKYAKRKEKLADALVDLVNKLLETVSNKVTEKCKEEIDQNCEISFEYNREEDIQAVANEK